MLFTCSFSLFISALSIPCCTFSGKQSPAICDIFNGISFGISAFIKSAFSALVIATYSILTLSCSVSIFSFFIYSSAFVPEIYGYCFLEYTQHSLESPKTLLSAINSGEFFALTVISLDKLGRITTLNCSPFDLWIVITVTAFFCAAERACSLDADLKTVSLKSAIFVSLAAVFDIISKHT